MAPADKRAVISLDSNGDAVVKPGHALLKVGETIDWENTLTQSVELSIIWLPGYFKQTLGKPKRITTISPGAVTKPFKAKKVTGQQLHYQIYVSATGVLVQGGSDPDIEIK